MTSTHRYLFVNYWFIIVLPVISCFPDIICGCILWLLFIFPELFMLGFIWLFWLFIIGHLWLFIICHLWLFIICGISLRFLQWLSPCSANQTHPQRTKAPSKKDTKIVRVFLSIAVKFSINFMIIDNVVK